MQDRKASENVTSECGEMGDQILDLPASWVQRLELSRQQYENRLRERREGGGGRMKIH